jgi:hypothetical protein
LLISFRLFSQVEIEKAIAFKTEQIFNDPYGYIYTLSGNEFVKMNSYGETICVFQHEKRNRISGGDIKNPFKILLFIEDTDEIILLDQYLSKIDAFTIKDKTDLTEDAIVIGSESGGYYLFDRFKGQLIKTDASFKPEYLFEIRTDSNVQGIIEIDGKIYVHFESGALSYYNFESGELSEIRVVNTHHTFHISGQQVSIYNTEKNRIEFYDSGFMFLSFIELPAELRIIDAVYLNNKVVFIDGENLYISRVKRD